MSDQQTNDANLAAMQTVTVVRDWFIGAIEASGSVESCLQSVRQELIQKMDFVQALTNALRSSSPKGHDAITCLGHDVKILEQTFRARLGLLSPERTATWFRRSTSTAVGPFAGTILDDPVFLPFDEDQVQMVARGLRFAMNKRLTKCSELSFWGEAPAETSCLWMRFLYTNYNYEQISNLSYDNNLMRLDNLPEGLPNILESRPLKAFLRNVRNELQSIRLRIDAMGLQLLASSEQLWQYQEATILAKEQKRRVYGAAQNPNSKKTQRVHSENYASNASTVRMVLLPQDLAALSFMGFKGVPDAQILRQKYLILAKRLHPDMAQGSDVEFKRLTQSYEHLLRLVK